MEKGTIALDIDGTITDCNHQIPNEVVSHFVDLHEQGWQWIFLTGRTLSFAMMALYKIPFPYLLGVQNGADLIEMPSQKQVARSYLKIDTVLLIEQLYQGHSEDFIVYAGYEKGDFCYFRPNRFSKHMQKYLQKIQTRSSSPWREVSSFQIQDQIHFPLIECIGPKEVLEVFNQQLMPIAELKTTLIKDLVFADLYLILITDKNADKGVAIKTFMERYGLKRPLITGGNDNNDIPLLRKGDIRIAMDGSPEALEKIADIIAPSSDKMGIIEGLQRAIQ